MRRKVYKLCIAMSAMMLMSGCQGTTQGTATGSSLAKETVEGSAVAGESTAGTTKPSSVIGANYISSQTEITDIPLSSLGTIALPDYSRVEVTMQPVDREVTDEDVTTYLNYLLSMSLREVTGRGAEKGDVVTIDFTGTQDGAAFSGNSGTDVTITLGAGEMLPDFEAAIYGAKAGDTVKAEVTFPEDYTSEEVAGKTAAFEITVKKLEEPEELTEDFIRAHSMSGAETEAAFREELREELRQMTENEVNRAAFLMALDQLAAKATLKPSEAFSDYLYRYYEKDFEDYLESAGMSREDYKTEVGVDDAGIEKLIWNMVSQNSGQLMILRQIAAEQGLDDVKTLEDGLLRYAKEMYGEDVTEEMVGQLYGDTRSMMALQAVVYEYMKERIEIQYQESETTGDVTG